ncbi:MAG: N-acetyltransferase [Patescibacteria group bacterium]
MEIRKATEQDAPTLSVLIASIISHVPYYNDRAKAENIRQYRGEALHRRIKSPHHLLLIAQEEGGKIVGFCSGVDQSGTFYAEWIGVDPATRRQGVAQVLVDYLFTLLRESGNHKIWLDTRADNLESISFLQKMNFAKVGELKNHWFNQDYYIWEKFL